MKEVGRSQRAWGPAKKPGGESAKGEDRWEGGREGEARGRNTGRYGGLIHRSTAIRSSLAPGREWSGDEKDRDGGWTLCPSLPVTLTTTSLFIYLHHPSSPTPPLPLSSFILHSAHLLLSSTFCPCWLHLPLSCHLSSFSVTLYPSLQLPPPTHHLSSTFLTFRTYYLLLIHLQTLSLWSQNSAEEQSTRHEK